MDVFIVFFPVECKYVTENQNGNIDLFLIEKGKTNISVISFLFFLTQKQNIDWKQKYFLDDFWVEKC